jgi:hypothetical protein
MKHSKVYLYEERHTCARVVGKFFHERRPRHDRRHQRMRQEFDNLEFLRGYGLAGYPHHVVRPLGTNAWLNSILVEEYAAGVPLSAFVNDAIHQGQSQPLFEKLTALAYFLATLHNRTANGQGVDFHQDCAYLDRLVRKLESQQVIGAGDADELYWLRDRWREKPRMWEDNQVLVHGDATPSNLLFGQRPERDRDRPGTDEARRPHFRSGTDCRRVAALFPASHRATSTRPSPSSGTFCGNTPATFPTATARSIPSRAGCLSRWLSRCCASRETPG